MDLKLPKVALSEGISISDLLSRGSTLHINQVYDETDDTPDLEPYAAGNNVIDFIGAPVKDFTVLAQNMTTIDPKGYVKKKILEEGGGFPINNGCTVSIAFSGYFEDCNQPFDVRSLRKPLEVDLSDSGLLPGLEMALRTMLVGEMSMFLLSHEVMYGELGIPPRIKPKAPSVFYIRLIRSILTNNDRKINFSESNIFQRVHNEVLKLYGSGFTLYQSSEYNKAINLFKKAINMLHKCRLADEKEERIQEKLLKKLYLNLAILYNKTKQPLKTCTACNELNRLDNLWNNGKALLQNAKALRMIGDYDSAKKRLQRAMKLCPNSKEMEEELDVLYTTKETCNEMKLFGQRLVSRVGTVNDEFKRQVNLLIKNFKENDNLNTLTLPSNLSSEEMEYLKNVCIQENLFCNKMPESFVDNHLKENEKSDSYDTSDSEIKHFALAKKQIDTDSDVMGEDSLIGEDHQVIDFNNYVSFPPLNGKH